MRASAIILEMSFDKKVAEARIRTKEEVINLHLVKLLAFSVDAGVLAYWRKEILTTTGFIAGVKIRVGNGARSIPSRQYYKFLYLESFEHNEMLYTQALIRIATLKAEQENTPLVCETFDQMRTSPASYNNSIPLCLLNSRQGRTALICWNACRRFRNRIILANRG